jgi:hypothetical protein
MITVPTAMLAISCMRETSSSETSKKVVLSTPNVAAKAKSSLNP